MTFSNINTVLNTTHTYTHTLAITDTEGNRGSMLFYYKKQMGFLTKIRNTVKDMKWFSKNMIQKCSLENNSKH